ncbi:MAG: hypothetical protein RL094_265 [Candidatus Parcubacteria bacterium]|jgi:uncharacterized UPF0160 family protein
MKTIVTHGANFHTDDVFATATVLLYLEKNGETAQVIRSFDESVWKTADYVLDIGRVSDPDTNRFDHHQGDAGARTNGIPYASFGLVWKKFGVELCDGSERAAQSIDDGMIAHIDADDNGVSTYTSLFPDIKVFTIDEYVGMEADAIKSLDYTADNKEQVMAAFDKKFAELVQWAKGVITSAISKAQEKLKFEKEAIEAYEQSEDKRIIILKRFLPYTFANFPEPLIIIYPDLRVEGCWCAKTVKLKNESLKARIDYPEAWRGKFDADLEQVTGVKGAKFSHASGFLMSAYSKEAVIELAQKALRILGK